MTKQGSTLKNFRLSGEGVRLLEQLAEGLGVSQTSVIEIAIREKAKKEKMGSRNAEKNQTLNEQHVGIGK